MRSARSVALAGDREGDSCRSTPAPGADDWLRLAAAPTFALMALLTALFDGGRPDPLCSAAQGALSLGGMAAMYGLMSLFHAAPWLKLISGGGRRARRS